MSADETILRVAAKGDGITASGRHVAFTAPGDVIRADGSIVPGPSHATPPCRYFGTCGGCELQHLDEATLIRFVYDRVVNAASGQDLVPEMIAPACLSPPRTRRRATLHAERGAIGFRSRGSHRLIDLRECHVLHPDLFALVAPLRALLARWPGKRLAADIHLVLVDQGVAVELKGLTLDGLAQTEGLLDFARDHRLARLTLDQGYGPEAMWEPEPVTVTLAGVAVGLPPGGFLQATADAEAALVGAVREWLGGSAAVADLFAGLGTFAFALAGPGPNGTRVLAVEAAQDAHFACKAAAGRSGKPVHSLHRDLYRNPLRTEELDRFAAVVLDPPRAGARDQVEQIAASKVERVAYVSCNPSSWARDAATLVAGGYRLAELRPVGQFRWSTHVELASLFVR